MYDKCQQKPQRTGGHVAFPPGYLLVRVASASRAGLSYSIDRLSVTRSSIGTGLSLLGHACSSPNPAHQPLKEVQAPSFPKMIAYTLPRGKSADGVRYCEPVFNA